MKKLSRKVTVYEWQVGLLYRRGRLVRQAGPGLYKLRTYAGDDMYIYDTRPTVTSFVSEVSTKDKLAVSASVTIFRKITDPKKLVKNTYDNEQLIREWTAAFLRDEVAKLTVDDVQEAAVSLGKALDKVLPPKLEPIGLEATEMPIVRISLPRSVKKAFEQEIVARKKALAELEEARGKTAVLRHLANAAKLVEERPAIYKLLLSQKVRSLSVQLDEKQK